MIEMIEERPEIKKLRDEFIVGLPKVLIDEIRFLNPGRVRCIMLYLILVRRRRNTIHPITR
jgi:hypothetical protein